MFTVSPRQQDRREFLRSCGRWTGLTLLGGMVVTFARQGKLQPLNEACLSSQPCGGCPVLGRCEFPAAVAGRRQIGGQAT
ncbi:MAG: hypothetical protein HS113_23070 [Verrucomicrobiales bacterium]|nr:hypothetical protein [Verrucomicrobiales bacterium]